MRISTAYSSHVFLLSLVHASAFCLSTEMFALRAADRYVCSPLICCSRLLADCAAGFSGVGGAEAPNRLNLDVDQLGALWPYILRMEG